MPAAPVATSFRVPGHAGGRPAPQRPADVELLAPAGSFEALVAAVENGADAVYLGGRLFNARKFAANFDDAELARAVDYAHVRGVKVFVTVNTLIFNSEFGELVEFLGRIHDLGVDAVIVQDLGVMRAARQLVPDLPVHISTQATVHNSQGIHFLESLGAERIILAREMTLQDIHHVKERTGAELEHFVHGALCYCYSGQCLMSSVIGGRSGNRGACAYTCRLPFSVAQDGAALPHAREKHVLSSKDLNTVESIPQLIAAGVTSFKIEGRMKRPEYVATVVDVYRKAIDRHFAGNFHVTAEEKERLLRIFNREFTPGYLEGKEKWTFTNWDTAGNRGTPVGEVTRSGKGWVRIRLNDDLRVKDGIEILNRDTGTRGKDDRAEHGFEVRQILNEQGRWLPAAQAGEEVELRGEQWSVPGDLVFKTSDFETLERARKSYQGSSVKRMPIELRCEVKVGRPLLVAALDLTHKVAVVHEGDPVQPARNAPLQPRAVREQLERVGETPWRIGKLDADVGPGAFLPLKAINEARRVVLADLERAVAARRHRQRPADWPARAGAFLAAHAPAAASPPRPAPLLAVKCWTLGHVHAALEGGAQAVYFSGLRVGGLRPRWDLAAVQEAATAAHARGVPLYLDSGMIQKDHEVEMLRAAIRATRGQAAGVLAGNHGAFQVAREEGVPAIPDWPMNVYNSVTVDHMVGMGAQRITLSPELTLAQMADASRHTAAPTEALVHGRLTLMTSEYCTIGAATGCQKKEGSWAPCHDHQYRLDDRTGAAFPLETDGGCRMYILNSVELSMINHLPALAEAGLAAVRIESIGTPEAALAEQVRVYREALDRLAAARSTGQPFDYQQAWWDRLAAVCPDGFTTGHFFRGPE